jgi:cobalamin biosynthesis protein CobW
LVNDFGAIDIDADLLSLSSDGVVSLRNGCICCSLQGDLMRTLSTLIRRRPSPDAIVIETSGAADTAEIVRSLLDPMIFTVTPLETVVAVVDTQQLSDRPALLDDPLWRSQVRSADFCVLAKTDLVGEAELAAVRTGLAHHKPAHFTFDAGPDLAPTRRFFLGDMRRVARPTFGPKVHAAANRFESVSWTSQKPVGLAAFQSAIGRLAPTLIRAKGFITVAHEPTRPMLFQLVGSRATILPAAPAPEAKAGSRLVLIAEIGRLDRGEAVRLLDAAVEAEPGK